MTELDNFGGTDPDEADARLEKCRQNLNETIRSVRSYITGLAPESLRRAGFAVPSAENVSESKLPSKDQVRYCNKDKDKASLVVNLLNLCEYGSFVLQKINSCKQSSISKPIEVWLQADRNGP